ncbi:RNA chaperone ProQ [Pseudoalteromonas sp. CR1]|uniref:RNA chaperone ProQ n=1 Tax=unclassified Pseudoalteromonas TaxID=194690 RepID=UPI000730E575|nr:MULTISPECIES: RNA chaperone ProQ [unclassified Pseudoalteromonas]KTD90284.1 RNA chaperone ProQ [Pseudoalteromonas sp. H71]MBW4965610.1 RNA chaperone ProQ [Pseudoalteromonas sp. CR1]
METTNKLKDINEVLEFLYQEFSQCFKQKDGIKPLKVGIFKDIAERIEGSEKVSKTQVRQALRKYTSNWRYLEAVTKSEFRIDLDGNQGEKVEQEHIDHAQKALEESRAKMAKRKKQQRPRQDSDSKNFKKKPAHASKGADKNASANKTAKAASAKRSGKIEPLPAIEVKVNNKVKVKLGQALVNAVITEVNKDDVHVELVTGMQVKTKADSLYTI